MTSPLFECSGIDDHHHNASLPEQSSVAIRICSLRQEVGIADLTVDASNCGVFSRAIRTP
jgi:hypothetical protein